MKYIIIYLMVLVFVNCKPKNSVARIRQGNYWAEGNFINDTILDGMITFYNLSGTLNRKVLYKNGLKNGPYVLFFSNGHTSDSLNYNNDFPNGYHYVFDSTEKIVYKDYYINGIELGPRVTYENGYVNKYYFIDFDKSEIFHCFYDSLGRVTDLAGNIGKAGIYVSSLESGLDYGFFIYLIAPPNIIADYSLIMKNRITKKEKSVQFSTDKIPYVDTTLMSLDANIDYTIRAYFHDSASKINKVVITNLKWK